MATSRRYLSGKQCGALWAAFSEPSEAEFDRIRTIDRLQVQDARSGEDAAGIFLDAVGVTIPEMWACPSIEFVLGFCDGALANYHPAPASALL